MLWEILFVVFMVLAAIATGGTFYYPANNGVRSGQWIFLFLSVAILGYCYFSGAALSR
jgi:hypothetical protein